MRIRWLVILGLLVGCVSRLERTVIFRPIYVPHTGTLWLIEKDERPDTSDQLAVVVCHREALPACIRVVPTDARDGRDYASWLGTMPSEVRRLAALVPGRLEPQASTSTPVSAPQQAAPPAPIAPPQNPPAGSPPTRAPDNPY
jgi:hypothetical protein